MKDILRTVLTLNVINDQIISIKLQGQPFNMIIPIYALATDAEEEKL